MTASFDGLPPKLREIAEVAGLDAAMELAEHYGGTRVNIPAKVKPDGWLADCVGVKAATLICNHFRMLDADDRPIETEFFLPRGPKSLLAQARTRLARELVSGEVSVRAAARRTGLSERTAWRLKRKMGAGGDGNQGELF